VETKMQTFITIILIFVLIDVLLVGYVVYKRFRRTLDERVIKKIRSTWKEIIRETDHRHAIMEADKLLDYALSRMGYKGSLGSKLKKSASLFKKINDVWAAHKIRNNIAHKINYKVDEKTYKKSMLQFKQAFIDLNIF